MEKGQVLAECTHCNHPHILDSVLGKKLHAPLLYWFSAPKKIERCIDCRSELQIWNVSYDGKIAESKCSKCGLSHTFKKPRMRDWRLIRVTRRVDDKILDLKKNYDLTEIKGIGPNRAKILNRVGIKNILDLIDSSAPILSSKTGISEKFMVNWIKQAENLVTKYS
jgi:hypothetical protein